MLCEEIVGLVLLAHKAYNIIKIPRKTCTACVVLFTIMGIIMKFGKMHTFSIAPLTS